MIFLLNLNNVVKHDNYKHLYQNIIQYIINYKHKRKNKQVKQNYNIIVIKYQLIIKKVHNLEHI